MWSYFLLLTGECRQEELLKNYIRKIKINRYIQCYGNKENKEKMKNWNKKIRKIKKYLNRM